MNEPAVTDERNPSDDVLDAIASLIERDMSARIAYHGPYGATSQEQWTWDAEAELVREIVNDPSLPAGILAALTAAGFVVLRVPEGGLNHGDELERTVMGVHLDGSETWWLHRPVEVNND